VPSVEALELGLARILERDVAARGDELLDQRRDEDLAAAGAFGNLAARTTLLLEKSPCWRIASPVAAGAAQAKRGIGPSS
jgi:hypothetical protein